MPSNPGCPQPNYGPIIVSAPRLPPPPEPPSLVEVGPHGGVVRGNESGGGEGDIIVTGKRWRSFGIAITISVIRFDTMFGHFLGGSGENVCLTGPQFRNIAKHARPIGQKIPFLNDNYARQVVFDNFNYRNTFGTATIYYNQGGSPIGFYDFYNMDPGKGRGFIGETLTQGGSLGYYAGAKDFEIGYPCR